MILGALAVIPAVLAGLLAKLLFEGFAGPRRARPGARLGAALIAAWAGTAVVTASCLLLGVGMVPPQAALGAVAGTVTFLLAAALRSVELRAGEVSRRIFFVGSPSQARDLKHEVERKGGMLLVGVASDNRGQASPSLSAQVVSSRATTLVMSGEAIGDEHLVSAASQLNLRGLRVRALGDFYEEQFAKVPLSELSQAWFLFDVAEIHRAGPYGIGKRVMEMTVSAVLLGLSLPLWPAIALAVRLSSPGPILFRQQRIGKDGAPVTLTKFRTMRVADEETPAGWSTDHGNRITRVGRFLRRFRLDELPQLFHVVRGDLGLVGPRPEQPEIVARLSDSMEFYPARHAVRPGLTGWAQVNFGYGGSSTGAIEKLQYDFFYIKRQSLRLDLQIIASTVRIVIAGKGL